MSMTNMRKKLLSILVLTTLVALTLVGCSQEEGCSSTLTILSITEGDVFVMKAGTDSWVEAQVGVSLEVGDSIKTGDSSGAEITFFDGSTIELEAGTEIEIISLDISADCASTTITLEQMIGTTISRVIKLLDPGSRYEIETPTGVAAVRGSVLIVTVGGNGTTLLTNQQGDIWAIAEGVELQIPEGQQCIIIPGQPPNLMPLAEDDVAVTNEHTPVIIHVLNNDYDPDVGDTLAVDSVTQGTNGLVTNNGSNVTYTPDLGFNGTDSFTYTISDGNGGTDTATVTVTVTGTLARINVQIDTGPTAAIFIWDDTINWWATDEDTGEEVDGTNHVTSDTITVAEGHYYYVWVEAADVIYYVKHCPKNWIITSIPEGDAEAAYGYTTADSLVSVHFTLK